jgi:hypothetical protein
MSHRTRRLAAVLGASALILPGAAVADGKGKAPAKSDGTVKTQSAGKTESRAKGKVKKVKLVTYVVKGVYEGAGRVEVTGGNSHTRRAGLLRKDVRFDFGQARLVVADTDGDGRVTEADLQPGDRLKLQLKLPRPLGEGPYAVRKVVDRTHPPVGESESETERETETETETERETETAGDEPRTPEAA